MPKFSFQFQSILNIKLQQEEALKNEFGKAVQRLEEEKAEQLRLENHLSDQFEQFNEKSSRGVTVEKLIEHNAYISYLSDRIKQQKENVNFAQQNVDKVREELIKAVQEREILDKLKDKKLEEFRKEQLRQEQQINDEVVSYKHSEKNTGDKDA